MNSSDDKSTTVPGAAWGKAPLSNEVADRIKQQTHENLQRRLRDQLEQEKSGRLSDRTLYDKEIRAALEVVDTLLDFIAQNAGEIPEHLLDVIAQRQEQRILATDSTSSSPVPISSGDGQVLRRTGGTLGWSGGIDLADTDAVTGLLPLSNIGQDATVDWTPVSVLKHLHGRVVKK